MIRRGIALGIATLLAVGCVGDDDNNEPTDAANGSANNDPNNDPNGTNRIVDPVIVHPCEGLPEDVVSAAAGVAVTETRNTPDDPNGEVCEWTLPDGTRIEASSYKRSNAADFYDGWDEDTGGYTTKTPLQWSPDGELRSEVFEGAALTSVFAYIINTDPVGRDVYIELEYAQGRDPDTDAIVGLPQATQLTMLESLGLELSKATRMAQPDGVEIPDIPQE